MDLAGKSTESMTMPTAPLYAQSSRTAAPVRRRTRSPILKRAATLSIGTDNLIQPDRVHQPGYGASHAAALILLSRAMASAIGRSASQ